MAINQVTGTRQDITEMLNKIRDITTKNSTFDTTTAPAVGNSTNAMGAFENVMNTIKGSVNQVNDIQNHAQQLQNAYSMGDKSVSLSEVVASSQKSRIALEGLMIVRNKILDAYKEIMSMPT
jgi:flagellar hook-basal body complex protein FliE